MGGHIRGIFTVKFVNFSGSDTLCRIFPERGIFCGVGLDDIRSNPIQLFPNPASDVLFVDLNAVLITGGVELSIVNVLGEKQKTFRDLSSDKEHRIDVSDLPQGMYFLYISNGNQATPAGKFVIER